MNPRAELTAKELRTVRFVEEAPALEAARRRRKVIGYARDEAEHSDEVEMKHEH